MRHRLSGEISCILILFSLSVKCYVYNRNSNAMMRLSVFFDIDAFKKLCKSTTDVTKKSASFVMLGYPLKVVYNRVPKTGSEMLRTLFREQGVTKYHIQNKEIFVPFRLETSVQQEVVQEISYSQSPFFYERHMYFIDFQAFQQPWPVYINIIRDPVDRVVSEYYWTRKICREENRCYFDTSYLNDTLDECVGRLSADECVSSKQGINSIIAFFCGHSDICENRSELALNSAKQNIIKHYAVVGVLEELYNFLYVLENVLPRYFKGISLLYVSNGRTREETKTETKGRRLEPNEKTKEKLRKALIHEYNLYEFVKQRFHETFLQVLLF